jgi:hypothetical protein
VTRAKLPAVALDPSRVDAWRLARQRLHPLAPAGRLEQVATELVGIQAQVTSAADLSLALRVRNGRVGRAGEALARRRLVKGWAMRGTLHLFAADDYPLVVAALSRREPWRESVWLRYFGVTIEQMERLIAAIGEILDDGRPRNRAELSRDVADHVGPGIAKHIQGSWGSFLKPAAYRGLLCQASGNGNGVTFVRPDRWLGSWRRDDPEQALNTVIRRYLACYGPASTNGIARWWGQQPKAVRPTIEAMTDDLTEVEVDGERGFVLTSDLDAIERAKPDLPRVRLLGAFDPLIVGVGTKSRVIPAAHLKRVSRTAGWISPVVLIDGLAAGVWTSQRTKTGLTVTVDPFSKLGSGDRRALGDEVERLGAIHELPATLEFGPVFATPTADVAGDA